MDHQELKRLLSSTTVSVPQVAAAIGFSEKRTYEAVKAGTIPSIRIGPRKIRIPTSWLAEKVGAVRAA
jgi:excisionase family DNA binding protein